MGGFFKPLRRKIGVVTLATSCVFAAMWIGSGFPEAGDTLTTDYILSGGPIDVTLSTY